jgi:hypothetical protein
VRDLVLAHPGRAAVIMGGGPSLATHLEQAPADALYLSVNDHGLRLLKDRPALSRRCSYVVCADRIEERVRRDIGMRDLPPPARDGAPWDVPVISRHPWGDWRLTYMPGPSSSMAAAWCARLMGCAPIILMGMDLWEGATYHDAPKARSSGRAATPVQHLQRWCTLLAVFPAQYRALGCSPLFREKCAHYDPRETPEPVVDRELLLRDLRSRTVRTLSDCVIAHRPFNAGEVLELTAKEADPLVRDHKAVFLGSP